ncbi:MAG: hypothetical protein A2Y38_07585 [Spirochaetes bacterium GWB1_59_5]|nr:MAG: hypothetical protein A2Y38_07585 [Spirochaetes bacterium GWB1_59_5]
MKRRRSQLSVKASLILFFTGFNTVLLLLLYSMAVAWYNEVQRRQIDDFLNTEATGIATMLTTFLNQEKSGEYGLNQHFQNPVFTRFLSDFLVQRLNRPVLYNTTLLLSDSGGRLISVSNQALNLDTRFLLDNLARIYDKKGIGNGTELFSVEFEELEYRVLQIPVNAGGTIVAWIRLACLLKPAIQSNGNFPLLVGLFFLISIAVNVLGAVALITRILRPVRNMNAAMNSVTELNLSSRLELPPGDDEISSLAITFNHTLDTIEKAFRSQEQLVNDLSHQLRTPLTSMRGAVELGLRKARSLEDYQAILEGTIVGIDRITSLVNTMLTLARLDGHTESLRYAPCDLIELIEGTVEELAPLWEEKSICFVNRYRFYKDHQIEEFQTGQAESRPIPRAISDLFVIEADALRFKQAIINLLDNAYKYTPRGGLISIELYREVTGDARFCRFVVMNDGPSIPDATLPRIFTPFYQGDVAERQSENLKRQSGQTATRGFGLGLSICRRIVEMHQGRIRAFNPVGGGAAFEIILPVKRSDAGAGILQSFDPFAAK